MVLLKEGQDVTVRDVAELCAEKGEDKARQYLYLKACIKYEIPSVKPEFAEVTLRTKRMMALESLDRVITNEHNIPRIQKLLKEITELTAPTEYDYRESVRFIVPEEKIHYGSYKTELSYVNVASNKDLEEYKRKKATMPVLDEETKNKYEEINTWLSKLFDEWSLVVAKGKHCEELLESIQETGIAADDEKSIKLIATMLHENIETVEEAMYIHKLYALSQQKLWTVEPEEVSNNGY